MVCTFHMDSFQPHSVGVSCCALRDILMFYVLYSISLDRSSGDLVIAHIIGLTVGTRSLIKRRARAVLSVLPDNTDLVHEVLPHILLFAWPTKHMRSYLGPALRVSSSLVSVPT